jgi:transmembrane sensor
MKSVKNIEAQAASWCAREDRGLSAAERAGLDAWLGEDLGHRIAYLRIKAAWQDEVITAAAESVVRQNAPRRWSFAPAPGWAAAAAVVLCLIVGGGYVWLSRPDVYATEVGQQMTVSLADGSRVELNTNTRLRAKIFHGSRTITIDRGEAYFHVAHNAAVPFVVFVGSQKVSDVGTKFLVRQDGDRAEILVTEGAVRIENSKRSVQPRFASAQDDIHVDGDAVVASKNSAQEIADKLSWRDGFLVFNQTTLAAVAAEFNRYNTKQIVVQGEARGLKIGGRFRSDNLTGFVALLHDSFGLSVRETEQAFVISK